MHKQTPFHWNPAELSLLVASWPRSLRDRIDEDWQDLGHAGRAVLFSGYANEWLCRNPHVRHVELMCSGEAMPERGWHEVWRVFVGVDWREDRFGNIGPTPLHALSPAVVMIAEHCPELERSAQHDAGSPGGGR